MLSDASLYSEHQCMQVHDTELFLSSTVRQMDWSQQEQDVVMDIGCGPGSTTFEMLLPAFPKVKKLIGVDVLPGMVEFAKENNVSEKMEYHVLDIEDRSSIDKWSQHISKAISIYCFNWVKNQEEAFKNVYHMLKPGGQAALLFVLSTPFWDSYELHKKNPKWKKYLANADGGVPESHSKKYDASYYRSLLENIGFKIIICEDENRTYTYPSDENCRAIFYLSGLTNYIPEELRSDFKEDLFQGFIKFNGRSQDGKPLFYYKILNLLIQKPKM